MSGNEAMGQLASHMMYAWIGFGGLWLDEIRSLVTGGYSRPVRRLLLDLLLFPATGLLLFTNWVCLWLDELFYPQATARPLDRPVFIVGPPRSGTTHLHRVLARDEKKFCVSPAWEVFLAPSVIQKKGWRGLLSLDRKAGAPLRRTIQWFERKLLGGFEETHPSAMSEPEEDYFYLSTLMACSGWNLLCPPWERILQIMPGSGRCREDEIRRAVDFYDRCLRKQSYAQGGTKTVLSKNASFTSWIPFLRERFPDARFVVCMRPASEAIPSMLSTAEQAMESFSASTRTSRFRDLLTACMREHYDTVQKERQASQAGMFVVHRSDLKDRLPESLRQLGQKLKIDFSSDFHNQMDEMGKQSQQYRSRHSYTAAMFGMNPDELDDRHPVLSSDVEGTT